MIKCNPKVDMKQELTNLRKARRVLAAAGLRGTYADILIKQQIYWMTLKAV